MAVPDRPDPDEIITSAWGDWVHDATLAALAFYAETPMVASGAMATVEGRLGQVKIPALGYPYRAHVQGAQLVHGPSGALRVFGRLRYNTTGADWSNVDTMAMETRLQIPAAGQGTIMAGAAIISPGNTPLTIGFGMAVDAGTINFGGGFSRLDVTIQPR
jgi:hypothetical protein